MKRKYKVIADIIAIIIAFGICATFLVMITGCEQTPAQNVIVTPPIEAQNVPNITTPGSEGTPASPTIPTINRTAPPNITEPSAESSKPLPTGLTHNVIIQNFKFVPSTLNINPGDTVIWTNKDSAGHSVTSDTGNQLSSPLFAAGMTYNHTFNLKGSFSYHCGVHPSMHGTVNVGPEAAASQNTSKTDTAISGSGSTGSGGYGYGSYSY